MCYRQKGHVTFFRPYKDTHDINRVYVCTIWDKETDEIARGVAILSLDDTPNDEIGRQLAYNKAARILSGRYVHPVTITKAWEAIQALKPLELRDFISNFSMFDGVGDCFAAAYVPVTRELTDEEYEFFTTKKKYIFPQKYEVDRQDNNIIIDAEDIGFTAENIGFTREFIKQFLDSKEKSCGC